MALKDMSSLETFVWNNTRKSSLIKWETVISIQLKMPLFLEERLNSFQIFWSIFCVIYSC